MIRAPKGDNPAGLVMKAAGFQTFKFNARLANLLNTAKELDVEIFCELSSTSGITSKNRRKEEQNDS